MAPPLDIYDYPVNRFVAGFLGTPAMNFMPGRLAAQNGSVYFESGPARLRLLPKTAARVQAAVGRSVTLGVRPEDISSAGTGKYAGAENAVPCTVRVVEPLGDEQIVHLSGPGDVALVSKLDPHVSVGIDEQLTVYLAMDRVHLFDDQTGDNISLEPEHVASAS